MNSIYQLAWALYAQVCGDRTDPKAQSRRWIQLFNSLALGTPPNKKWTTAKCIAVIRIKSGRNFTNQPILNSAAELRDPGKHINIFNILIVFKKSI